MTISTEVLAVLADVLETREVYDAPDLPPFVVRRAGKTGRGVRV